MLTYTEHCHVSGIFQFYAYCFIKFLKVLYKLCLHFIPIVQCWDIKKLNILLKVTELVVESELDPRKPDSITCAYTVYYTILHKWKLSQLGG